MKLSFLPSRGWNTALVLRRSESYVVSSVLASEAWAPKNHAAYPCTFLTADVSRLVYSQSHLCCQYQIGKCQKLPIRMTWGASIHERAVWAGTWPVTGTSPVIVEFEYRHNVHGGVHQERNYNAVKFIGGRKNAYGSSTGRRGQWKRGENKQAPARPQEKR